MSKFGIFQSNRTKNVGIDLFSRLVAKQVSSAPHSLTSVFGMGTGGPCAIVTPTFSRRIQLFLIKKTLLRVFLKAFTCVGIDLFSRTVASQVSSAPHSLTSVFGMGTGGPCAIVTPTMVHLRRLELRTHWLRVSCSTNWARGASIHPYALLQNAH